MEPIGIAFGVISAIVTAMGGPSAIVSKIIGGLGGGNAGAIASKVVDTATQAFGTTDPEKIKLQIAQDKSKLDAFVAQVDAQTKEYQIEVEDRKDARARDLAIRELKDERGVAAGTNMRANVMLVMAFFTLMFVLGGTITFRSSIPDGILGILNATVGALLTQITLAFNFEFGSSRGSSEKSNTISNLAESAASNLSTAAKK